MTPRPALSPSFIPDASTSTVRIDSGPDGFMHSVFRAAYKFAAASEWRRSLPGFSKSDHLESSGTWFHCHVLRSLGPSKLSSCGNATFGSCFTPVLGLIHVLGALRRLPGK